MLLSPRHSMNRGKSFYLIKKRHSKIYLERLLQSHHQNSYFFMQISCMWWIIFFSWRNCSLKIVGFHLFGKSKIEMPFPAKKLAWNWKQSLFPSKKLLLGKKKVLDKPLSAREKMLWRKFFLSVLVLYIWDILPIQAA